MPNSSAQSRMDRNAYIPPHIQQAMTTHMQQSMPAHLKKYVGSNAAYVPRHMEAAVAQQMQKNMPAHLKQYAGAYMQQQVIQPNASRLHGGFEGPRPVVPHAPTPDKLRRGHSMYGEQHSVELNTLPQAQDKTLFQSETPAAPPPNGPHHPDYDFFMNTEQPPKKPLLPSTSGLPKAVRTLVVMGVVFALLVGFVVAKNLISGTSNLGSYIAVAQDQQELIHLASAAAQQQDLSTDNQNFTATAQLSLNSAQSSVVQYLTTSNQKVNVKQLNAKVSTATDQQLATAQTAGTYNQTYREVMKAKLNEYAIDLQRAFQTAKSQTGQDLLGDNYTQAKLLIEQLDASASTSD